SRATRFTSSRISIRRNSISHGRWSTAATATSRSHGRRRTAGGACSIRAWATTPTTGTTRCCSKCMSRRSAGPFARRSDVAGHGLRTRDTLCQEREPSRRVVFLALCVGLMVAIASSGPVALQQPPGGRGRGAGRGAAPRARKAVLAWADTRNGIAQHDSVSHALAVIERLGYESGVYDTYIRTDSSVISKHPTMTDGKPASGGPSLANVDAIFFLGH